jgi:hypothetical protein
MKTKFFFLSLFLAILVADHTLAIRYYYGGSNAINYDTSPVYIGDNTKIILRIEIYVYSGTGTNKSFVLNSMLLSTNGSTTAVL